MYEDMKNLLAQKGVPAVGLYGGGLRENAALAMEILFANDVAINPTSREPVTTSAVILNNAEGIPVYRIAHANYNLMLDNTGMHDITHSVFAHGSCVGLEEVARLRKIRKSQSPDVTSEADKGHAVMAPGYQCVVDIAIQNQDSLMEFAVVLQDLAAKLGWALADLVVSGSYVKLTVLTPSSTIEIQVAIIDWIAGLLKYPVSPPSNCQLTKCEIVSTWPVQYPLTAPR